MKFRDLWTYVIRHLNLFHNSSNFRLQILRLERKPRASIFETRESSQVCKTGSQVSVDLGSSGRIKDMIFVFEISVESSNCISEVESWNRKEEVHVSCLLYVIRLCIASSHHLFYLHFSTHSFYMIHIIPISKLFITNQIGVPFFKHLNNSNVQSRFLSINNLFIPPGP